MVFASGMAAAAALFQSLAPGQRVLAPKGMYWALRRWLLQHAAAWGLEARQRTAHAQAVDHLK